MRDGNYIYIDIETIPTQRADIAAALVRDVKHPGTMSKPETIARWEQEEKPNVLAKIIERTALEATFGELLSFAIGLDEDNYICDIREVNGYPDNKLEHRTCSCDSEHKLLEKFLQEYTKFSNVLDNKQVPSFVGYNSNKFDLRFLWKRLIINGFKLYELPDFFGRQHVDLMLTWCGYSPNDWISMDLVCQALRIPSSKLEGVDGSMVWSLVRESHYAALKDYNIRDLLTTMKLHKVIGDFN